MTISITAKPFEVKAKLEGYGIFYLRRLGAAQEAELQYEASTVKKEMDTVAEKFKGIIEKEKQLQAADDKAELETLRKSDEYLAAQAEQQRAAEKVDLILAKTRKAQLSLWRSDDEEALKRLFNDFTLEELKNMWQQVMSEADNA